MCDDLATLRRLLPMPLNVSTAGIPSPNNFQRATLENKSTTENDIICQFNVADLFPDVCEKQKEIGEWGDRDRDKDTGRLFDKHTQEQ